MVKRGRVLLGAGAGLVLLLAIYASLRKGEPVETVAAGPRRPASPETSVPRIGLDRLEGRPATAGVGRRDIFDFGQPPRPPEPPPAPPTVAAAPEVIAEPMPTPLPPLTVKYMGSLEARKGVKVAFFVTEKKEVLSGQVGDTVMNRFRIVKIGFESVDIQEVGSPQVRRLPLRGN